MLLMVGGVVLGVKAVRKRLSVWAGRIVVAVLSNIAHANTSALALKVAGAFADEK